MFNLQLTYKWLYWTPPSGPRRPAPDGLEQHWLETPSGTLEVLTAAPKTPTSGPPIFFAHGGMGSASVWADYMRYMADRGVSCYAVSTRGHGESWHPSYPRMVFCTTRGMLSDDLAAGIRFAEKREGSQVVLVGHSSGGGLSQGLLAKGGVNVKGLALLGAVPAFGSMGVYQNWAKTDPWFSVRMILQGWHPNSPLSSPALMKRIFFSDQVSPAYLASFQERLSRYESYLWPFSMMRPFAEPADILKSIRNKVDQKVLVLAGSKDIIMTQPIMEELAATYRIAAAKMAKTEGAGATNDPDRAAELYFVEGAGHHVQNDAQWEDGARRLLEFYKTVSGN